MIRVAIATIAYATLFAQATQQPPRDTRPVASASMRASIAGTVESDEAQPRKLRRVRVTLNGAALDRGGRTVITGDDGRFEFVDLPPGQYGLSAVKAGYVSARFASGRPARFGSVARGTAGTGLNVRAGDRFIADMRLAPGAVITGVVTDPAGNPEPRVFVTALGHQFVGAGGERRLSPEQTVETDDRGVYRIFGLPAGDYVVRIQRTAVGPDPAARLSSSDGRDMVAAPVFFPSSTDSSAATRVTVAAGEERDGIDIRTQYVPTASISGVVNLPAFAYGQIALTHSDGESRIPDYATTTSVDSTGAFSLPGITPGHDRLTAVVNLRSSADSAGSPWAGSVELDVNGEDLNVSVPLTAPFSVSGRLVLESTSGASAAHLGKMSLPIHLIDAVAAPPPSFRLTDDSHFVVTGLIPGAYLLVSTPAPGLQLPIPGGWWLRSVAVNGRDVLDAPMNIRETTDEIVVTLSDRASSVSGVVRDGKGMALADVFVIIFAADPSSRFFNSRRIAGVRTDGQGRYVVRNLPPGEYRAAAALDLEPGQWFDPELLRSLQRTAVPLTIAGVDSKILDLTLK
jgi:hypothetical protein